VAVQTAMVERNARVPEDRRMLLRVGINLGDVLVQGDDILGDGMNVAARLEARPPWHSANVFMTNSRVRAESGNAEKSRRNSLTRVSIIDY
jgi:class 3 adenylate cyclase